MAEAYRQIIKENIEYGILSLRNERDIAMLDEIINLMSETVCTQKSSLVIAGVIFPAAIAKSKLLKLNSVHIATIKTETQYCCVCNKETSALTYRAPEYTKSGGTALNRGVKFSDLSESDVHTTIRYGTSADSCTNTSAPSYTNAGYYPIYYKTAYKYVGETMTENGVSCVWLLEENSNDNSNGTIIVLFETHTLTTSNQTTVTVTDKDNKPLANVSVRITDATTPKTGTTNSNGKD